jgi:LysM repeat protein
MVIRDKSALFGTLFFMVIVALFPAVASAQVAEPEGDAKEPTAEWVKLTPQEYIFKWREIAVEHMEEYGIPASITMGQAILESGYGNGYLARVANNHFCIKCKSSWTGATITHADDDPNDCFRVYESAEESFRDHADFLNEGSRYDFLFAYDADDYKSWAKGLKKAGYATASDYAERLIGVIERYNLQLLDKKNGIKQYDEYLASKYDMDLASLQQSVANTADKSTEVAVSVSAASSAEESINDIATAYADRGIDPNNFRVTINAHEGYNVYLTNRAHYVVAKSGDSYESLSKLFDVSAANLRRFNDVAKGSQPAEGDIVYIERKLPSWMGQELLHTVAQGETLHDIAQLYGIRLKSLSKINTMRSNAELTAGRTIRLQ